MSHGNILLNKVRFKGSHIKTFHHYGKSKSVHNENKFVNATDIHRQKDMNIDRHVVSSGKWWIF